MSAAAAHAAGGQREQPPAPEGLAPLDVKREPVTFDLRGCARCHGDGHPQLTFDPLEYPVVLDREPAFTHWAPCPTNGQPILLRHVPKPKKDDEA